MYYVLLVSNTLKHCKEYLITYKVSKKVLMYLLDDLHENNITIYNVIGFKSKENAQEYINNH